MKGVYLAAFRADHPDYDIDYQDINGTRDIAGDMMDVDITKYDFIIASPPCNYWSRANYRRETSEYSQLTKHLLPDIIKKLEKQDKPYIVENVINKALMRDIIDNFTGFYYEVGRHSYFTNIMINLSGAEQIYYNVEYTPKNERQGGVNVHNVIEQWLKNITRK